MSIKGYFIVCRDTSNDKDIHFQQIKLENGEVIPDDQLELRDKIDSALTTLRILFGDQRERFEEYFRPLLSLAQLGLVGESANPPLSQRALNSLKAEIVSREGGAIKNGYMIKLGLASLALGLPAIILGILIQSYAPDLKTLGGFLFLWTGCMVGVWLSFGARKIQLSFDELGILEQDRLNPSIRLIFAGSLTMIIGLLIATKALTLQLGDFTTANLTSDIKTQLLIGALCGISEQALSSKVSQHAKDFLGIK
jgi:cation transporter-like permease